MRAADLTPGYSGRGSVAGTHTSRPDSFMATVAQLDTLTVAAKSLHEDLTHG